MSILSFGIPLLIRMAERSKERVPALYAPLMTLSGFGVIVFAHTVQVWLWAAWFLSSNALPDLESALFFAHVSYTTLGYGDIVLNEDIRLFSAFSAVTGLLTFGLSSAFLVGLIARIMPFKVASRD